MYTGLLAVGGLLGDRFGLRQVRLTAAVAALVLALPLFWLIGHSDPALAFLGQFGLVPILAPHGALFATTTALLFPSAVRMSGFSVAYNVGSAALGATAPMAASHLNHRHHGDPSPTYISMVCAVISIASLASAWRDPPGRQEPA